jgi:twitching motility protein PilI
MAFQTRLAERLRSARTQPRSDSWLAVEAAGFGFLLPLAQAGEIFLDAKVRSVPHTRPWFRGVANLRGDLHGVVDLAVFLGLRSPPPPTALLDAQTLRLVCLNRSLGAVCALQVDALAGLRQQAQLIPEPASSGSAPAAAPPPLFARRRLQDLQGRIWQEIQLSTLATHERFLSIAA